MPDLSYPSHWGCAGAVHMVSGAPRPCDRTPTLSVAHEYRFPRPHTTRLAVCDVHAEGEPDPLPLTEAQLADLTDRKRRSDEAWERAAANRQASGLEAPGLRSRQ